MAVGSLGGVLCCDGHVVVRVSGNKQGEGNKGKNNSVGEDGYRKVLVRMSKHRDMSEKTWEHCLDSARQCLCLLYTHTARTACS